MSSLVPNGTDASTLFLTTELTIDGKVVSTNLIYLTPTHEVHLPAAAIQTDVQPASGGYRVRLTAPVLARSVYLNFGSLDAEPADNYFDLLPGMPVEVMVKAVSTVDQLRAQLKVTSLVDALGPATAPATATAPPQ
jgi:beta-mannosidase